MNNKGQMEFDMVTIIAIALGVATGIISLIVSRGSPTGAFWKVITFILSSGAGFVVSYFIFNKD